MLSSRPTDGVPTASFGREWAFHADEQVHEKGDETGKEAHFACGSAAREPDQQGTQVADQGLLLKPRPWPSACRITLIRSERSVGAPDARSANDLDSITRCAGEHRLGRERPGTILCTDGKSHSLLLRQ